MQHRLAVDRPTRTVAPLGHACLGVQSRQHPVVIPHQYQRLGSSHTGAKIQRLRRDRAGQLALPDLLAIAYAQGLKNLGRAADVDQLSIREEVVAAENSCGL